MAKMLSTTTLAPAALAMSQTACEVDDLERRVGRRFEEDAFGVRGDRLLPGLQIIPVDQRRPDAEAWQDGCDDLVAGAEQRLGRDKVIAGLQLAGQRAEDRGHAGSQRVAGSPPLPAAPGAPRTW